MKPCTYKVSGSTWALLSEHNVILVLVFISVFQHLCLRQQNWNKYTDFKILHRQDFCKLNNCDFKTRSYLYWLLRTANWIHWKRPSFYFLNYRGILLIKKSVRDGTTFCVRDSFGDIKLHNHTHFRYVVA